MTARPRLIENMRMQVAYYENQISLIQNALENIHTITDQVKDNTLKNQLLELKNIWYTKEKQISSQLTVAKYQLTDKLSERKTFF